MSAKGELKIVIIFDDELRLAAKAMKVLIDAAETGPDAITKGMVDDALIACRAALFHLMEQPDCPIVILSTRSLNKKESL